MQIESFLMILTTTLALGAGGTLFADAGSEDVADASELQDETTEVVLIEEVKKDQKPKE
jgi:hypothetical protein